MVLTRDGLELVRETLRACWAEIEAMQDTYDDYVAAGHLEEQVHEALGILEAALDK